MYFSWLVQGSTSQWPAISPVIMATQPCLLPCIVKGDFMKCELWSHFLSHLKRMELKCLHTWHFSVPVCISHCVLVGPHKSTTASVVWEAYPEVFFWFHPHQADKECIIHPGTYITSTITGYLVSLRPIPFSVFTLTPTTQMLSCPSEQSYKG